MGEWEGRRVLGDTSRGCGSKVKEVEALASGEGLFWGSLATFLGSGVS